ncbi:MAG: hypothetical protein ACK55Z_30625, partial [bacterium]
SNSKHIFNQSNLSSLNAVKVIESSHLKEFVDNLDVEILEFTERCFHIDYKYLAIKDNNC